MSYEVDAIYNNGAFVPVTPLAIQEGVRVHLRVEEQASQNGTGRSETPPRQSRAALDEFLRIAAELPLEGPDDGFSGADHDRVLYGEP